MKKRFVHAFVGPVCIFRRQSAEPPKGRRPRLRGSSWCGCRKSRSIPARLAGYNAFLQEGIEASLRLEPGVLALYAVAAKEAPGQVTILEIYVDRAAYESHITTPHFRKYKEGTLDMVLSPRTRRCRPAYARFGLRQTVGTR